MSESNLLQVKLALVNARVALQNNNRMEARRWATRAASLAPDNEEAWLILSAVSSPAASLVYLKKALEINPKSERAVKGMQWALQRIQNLTPPPSRQFEPIVKGDTQPVRISPSGQKPELSQTEITTPVTPVVNTNDNNQEVLDSLRPPALLLPVKKPIQAPKKNRVVKSNSSLTATILLLLILLATAVIVWAALPSWVALARSAAAPIPPNVLSKPSRTPTLTTTPTATATATPTLTPTPTATNTALPTSTPYPTNTPKPQPTAAPYVPPSPQPAAYNDGHWIDIDLGDQMLYAYDGDSLVASFVVSTGTAAYPTVTGQFAVYVKYRYTDMSGPGYYLPDVPYTMYFYSGYGIHGTYWHNNFGTPMSHGCVNMRTSDAEWIFNFSSIGTVVNIHY
jgi:lipoprotein-anchoring transpeptidase ErfK/SrfK